MIFGSNILLRIVKYYLKLVTMKKSFQQHFPIFDKSVFLPCLFFDTPWACEKTVHVCSKLHQYDKTCIQTSGKLFSFLTLRSCNRLCMMSNEIENLLLSVDLLLWTDLLEIFTWTNFGKSYQFRLLREDLLLGILFCTFTVVLWQKVTKFSELEN